MFDDITYNYNTLPDLSRRILMKRIAYFISGLSLFPEVLYGSDMQEQNHSITSNEDLSTFQNFIEIVIPGASRYTDFLAEEICAEFYGFSKYFGYLIKNLNEQAKLKFSVSFTHLSDDNKKLIVREGTQSGLLRKQVYNGAIYLLQLIVFSGLCESDQSCGIIDFPGASRGEFQTYAADNLTNINSITSNGNPN